MDQESFNDVRLANGIVLEAMVNPEGWYCITHPSTRKVYSTSRGWVTTWKDGQDRYDSLGDLALQTSRVQQVKPPTIMSLPVVKYTHHKNEVYVRQDLKGKHRDYCLCHTCGEFNPSEREKNCHVANELFANCIKYGVVTPVWECPLYIPRDPATPIS